MAYRQWFQSLLPLSLILFPFCISTDTITPTHSLKDGQILISASEKFAFGFFSPGKSKYSYAGIWYHKAPDQPVVWVANRENPVKNSSGVLAINGGDLILLDRGGNTTTTLWSTNVSSTATATLNDSGNLVLRDNHGRVLWESFDYPTHTLLPDMKIGLDRRTGLKRMLTSWKSPDDPARGEFSVQFVPRGLPQFFLMKGSDPIWRSGPWNGQGFSGVPAVNPSLTIYYNYVANDDEVYFSYGLHDSSINKRNVLDDRGEIHGLTWSAMDRQWNLYWVAPDDSCDRYQNCGACSSCDADRAQAQQCKCLQGFEPRSGRGWSMGDWSEGCVRRGRLGCGRGDGFARLALVKLPDASRARLEPSLSLRECERKCLNNCSCTAYACSNVSGEGSGCVMWDGDLIDLRVYTDGGQDIYTRVAASDMDKGSNKHSGGSLDMKKQFIIVLIVGLVLLAFITCGYYWWRKAKGHKVKKECDMVFNENDFDEENGKDAELPLFDLGVITTATKNFSEANMLGKGGFGHVYKGELLDGQEIAVKRLSKSSGQGAEEFKNEVRLIAKLQHRNLVRVLGCCIGGQEKMLIYEYMRNKSLDSFIFDQTKRVILYWKKRFSIIVGIARGILYLHEDSRLRIIHRDLKISNVLLDDEMNPKISDFGMARILGGEQTHANTNRVVGTYGYMSPEYAMEGVFSVKSDVFSFGVLLLEIISGKRNTNYMYIPSINLIGHAWELWKEGRALELIDASMKDSCSQSEVLRCIHVGLLCVQDSAEDRPNMSSVVFMLSNETTMPSPVQPTFSLRRSSNQLDSTTGQGSCSTNEVTITEVDPR